MRKKRVLFITEATYLNTGYATYGKEVLERLSATGKYDIAEFSIYGHEEDARRNLIKWKNYPNAPRKDDEEGNKQYNSNPANQFGAWRFERVCLDFKPDIVCMPPETIISTEDGFVKICDIKNGDKVLTHTGKYQKVTQLMRREHSGTIRSIKINGDCSQLKLTNEHPVLVYKKRKQTNQKKSIAEIYKNIEPEFIEAKDVKKGDLVVFPQNKTVKYKNLDIREYLTNYISVKDNYIRPLNHGTVIKTNINIDNRFGLLCGYILGDGHINNQGVYIHLGGDELEFVKEVQFLFKEIFDIDVTYKKLNDKYAYIVSCNSRLIGNFFNKLLNSKNKRIPKEIRFSNEDCKKGLIKGLIRSDGCYKNNTVSFCSISKNLSYEYRQICIDIGIPVNISYNRGAGKNGSYEVNGYGESAVALHNISQKRNEVYNHNSNALRRSRSTQIINGHMVASVKRCRNMPYCGLVYNISVNNDESYVSNWCVHNCSIRDYWMDSFIKNSPFRRLFHWSWMVTCDAEPQQEEWVHYYSTVDTLSTYCDWAVDTLKKQYPGNNIVGSTPPGASPYFTISDRREAKAALGLNPECKIIGTVMRNQRRKLFPELFEAFGKYLKETGDLNTFLYCHTSYPDNGWDFPKLLWDNEISSRVLFTYVCASCGDINISRFNDTLQQCKQCRNFSSKASDVGTGVSTENLAKIYQTFDCYVQCSNCLPLGEKVLLKDGWKNIEDVKIGDVAFTHKNRWKPVIQTFEHDNVNATVYEFGVFADYDTTKSTEEHPIYVVDKEAVGYHGSDKETLRTFICRKKINLGEIPHKFIEAKNVDLGDLIVYPIDRTEINQVIDLTDYLDEDYRVQDNYFKHKRSRKSSQYIPIKTEVDSNIARFIGLYVADGSSNHKGAISITSHINEKLNQDIAMSTLSKFGKAFESIYKDRNGIGTIVSNKVFATYLLDNCGKHEFKKLPDWSLTLPVEQQKAMLNGLFLGDGHYSEKNNVSIYCTISEILASQIKQLCRRIGLNYNVCIKQKPGNRKQQYRFEIRGNIKNNEFDTKISSTRNFIAKDYYYYQVKSIKKSIYTGKVYNFEVEDDNSYLTKIGIYHNSEGFGMSLAEAGSCGVPILAVDYSAMSDIVRKLHGYPINVKAFYHELETGCKRAIPDTDHMVSLFKQVLSIEHDHQKISDAVHEHFNWDKTSKKWETIIDAAKVADWSVTPNYVTIPDDSKIPKFKSNEEFITWGLSNYLPDKTLDKGFDANCVLRDLNFGTFRNNPLGFFYSEVSYFNRENYKQLTPGHIIQMLKSKAGFNNFWEQARATDRMKKESWLE